MTMPRVAFENTQSIADEDLPEALRKALEEALKAATAVFAAQEGLGQFRPFEIIQRFRGEDGDIVTLAFRYSPAVKQTVPESVLQFSYMEEIRRVFDCAPYGVTWAQIEAITCLPSLAINRILERMEETGEIVKFMDGDKELYKFSNTEARKNGV